MAMLNFKRIIEKNRMKLSNPHFFRDSVIHFGVQTMVQPSSFGAFDPSGDCKVLPSPVAQCPHAGKIGIPMDSPIDFWGWSLIILTILTHLPI